MLDIGWTELLIVGVVALIVVGPKDLPRMFRTLGEFTGKARSMAREFQRAMESAADDAGVKDVARELRDTTSGRKLREASGLDEMERDLRDIERDMSFDEKVDGKPGSGKADAGKAGKAGTPGDEAGEFDEEGADDLIAAEHDAEATRRKPGGEAREAQRRKRAEDSAEARRKAADLRAARDGGGEGGEGGAAGADKPGKATGGKAAPKKAAPKKAAAGKAGAAQGKAAAPKRQPATGDEPASSGKAATGRGKRAGAGKTAEAPRDDGPAGGD